MITTQQVHTNKVLTNVATNYMQDANYYIADKVFPVIPVDHKSDTYTLYKREDWMRDEAKPREGSTESAGSSYDVDTDTYNAIKYAFHKDIADDMKENADSVYDLEKDATEFVTGRILIKREKDFASSFMKEDVWGFNKTGVGSAPSANNDEIFQWSDETNSNIFGDIEQAKLAVLSVTGLLPNTLVLGYEVFAKIRHLPEIRDRIKYVSADAITEQMLAKLLEVDRVFISKAAINSKGPKEEAQYSFSQGKNAWLGYTAPNASLLNPSAGYIFWWKGVNNLYGKAVNVKRFRIETKATTRVEAEGAWDMKIVAPELGYFFKDIVS